MEKASLVSIRENEKELMEVAENACKVLEADHNIPIHNPKVLLTIGFVHIKELLKHLANSKSTEKDVDINFVNLFKLGVSYRENDEAEKEGNYVPSIEALDGAKKLSTPSR